jgi:hypothetical protein
MGLGTDASGRWDEYEWFRLDEVVPLEPFVLAGLDALERDPVWLPGDSTRILLVDLDNLRVEPARLRGRLAMAIALARQADHAAFAGQEGSVRRSREALAEFGDLAITVGRSHDEADWALLDAAQDVEDVDVQFVVVSNDGIFTRLAMRGPVTVLSPGVAALSYRLAEAAERVVDLEVIEAGAPA